MTDIKEILEQVKEKLAKLKDVKNDVAKEVYDDLNGYIETISVEAKVEVKEETTKPDSDKKEEEKEDDDKAEDKKEDKVEANDKIEDAKEDTKEEAKEDVKEDEPKADEPVAEPKKEEPEADTEDKKELNAEVEDTGLAVELSHEVADKLKAAAIELDAKHEIIEGFKSKVVELEAELTNYKEKEQIELKKRFEAKAQDLIILYANLGIKKEVCDIELFSETQVDKLIGDLQIAQSKTVRAEQRQTSITPGLELSKSNSKKDKVMTGEARARLLLQI